MKITFLASQYARISGGNRALFEYANRLKKMGHSVRWFVLGRPARWYRIDHWPRIFNKKISVLAPDVIDWMDNEIPIELLSVNDRSLIPNADILLATAWQTADFSSSFSEDKGKKFYFVQHHESLWTREKNRAQRTYYMPFRKMVISSWLKNILYEQYKQEADVLVTPVNNDIFFKTDKNKNAGIRVCMLHHDYDWKGYKDAIEAVKKVRSENCKIELVVFGEKLKDPTPLYEEAGFAFEYHYRPTGEALRKIYSSCGTFLCSSWYEGLGMPAMEAMMCGAALVTTDTGGSWDYALNEETALVSPSKDPEALAKNLARILGDDSLRLKLAEMGYKKIRQFSWDTNCEHLIKCFECSINNQK
ncbi:MAG: glycosyltransferase family 4 protein [Nitrospinota bacterium]|nr:glycosyltransferase family 4 protein [Nitrospinota bacterium]